MVDGCMRHPKPKTLFIHSSDSIESANVSIVVQQRLDATWSKANHLRCDQQDLDTYGDHR